MTEEPVLNQEDFVSDLFGVKSYENETKKKKGFLPWHKPRKQFVRQAQWIAEINDMVEERMPDNNILKYLGLPGDDLLDIRFIHEKICEPHNLHLKFLGFNTNRAQSSSEKSELNISLDEVSKLKNVDHKSDVIGDDICKIADVNSIAFEAARKMGPYDVINIDLCNGFGKHPPDKFLETHYNTVYRLMTLQARRDNPWLLLLTTRTGPEHIDPTVFTTLKSLYNDNLNSCPGFQMLSNNKFSINSLEALEVACKDKGNASNVFLIAICKWIAKLASDQNPPAQIDVKSVLGYKVNRGNNYTDLVSIAIRINPTLDAQPDRVGLASINLPAVDECITAIQALEKVSKLGDVDKILSGDGDLMESLITATGELLEAARYDVEGYSDWAKVP